MSNQHPDKQSCFAQAGIGMAGVFALIAAFHMAPSAAQQTQASAKPAVKIDQTKLDRYYGDPTSPNISGVWRVARSDGYLPLIASDRQRDAGVRTRSSEQQPNGLPAGVLPRGVWLVDGKPLPGLSPGGPWVDIPYTPKWQAAYVRRVEDNRLGKVYGDPHFDCLPRGAMGSYDGGPNAFAITQTVGRVQQIFFQEQTGLQNIYTDGRKHPSWADPSSVDYEPTPYGHAIGHWQGKTLVVDITGVDRVYTLGHLGMHSDVFHMVERVTRISDTELDIEITVDDRKALLKPMSMRFRYVLQVGEDFKEETCTNNRNMTDENGIVQTLLKPRKGAGWDLPDD